MDYYEADVITANDYYPFGMTMPGRTYSSQSGYRYGFNGKEKDLETTGTTTYDYGFRIYNPALGKFLSVDPLTQSYPWYTPYQFAGNKPIIAIDIDGLEERIVIKFGVYGSPRSVGSPKPVLVLTDYEKLYSHAVNTVVSMLKMERLKNPTEPTRLREFGTRGYPTVSQQRAIIQSTVYQYLIMLPERSGQESILSADGKSVTDIDYYSFDFDYSMFENKDDVLKVREAIKTITTVIEYVDESKYGLPIKKFDKLTDPASIVSNINEGNGFELVSDITKMLVEKGIEILAKSPSKIAPIAGVVASKSFGLTIDACFSNTAPDLQKQHEENYNNEKGEITRETIAAMLFLFQNGNKPNIVIKDAGLLQFEMKKILKDITPIEKPKIDNIAPLPNIQPNLKITTN